MSKEITGWTIRYYDRHPYDELLPVYLHADGEWREEPFVFRDKATAESFLSPGMPWRRLRRVARKRSS